MNETTKKALHYARLGWFVFPIAVTARSDGPGYDKRPLTPNGHLGATNEPVVIRHWFNHVHPDAGVGIALRQSGMIAIDVDRAEEFRSLESTYGELPRELHQKSISGGEHILFRDPSPGADGWTRPGCLIKGKLPGADIKCNGWIAVEPTPGYSWEKQGEAPNLPDAWVRAIKKPAVVGPDPSEQTPDAWLRDAPGPITEQQAIWLRHALDSVGPGGRGTSSTFKAVALIFHHYGLSLESGWGYLEYWNSNRNRPHSARELGRQARKISKMLSGPRGLARSSDIVSCIVGDTPSETVEFELPPLASEVVERDVPPVVSHPTGHDKLDILLGGGITSRQLTVVVGPPGAGKSAWAVDISLKLADEMPVLYVSTELEEHELEARISANVMDRPWRGIVRGQVDKALRRDALKGKRIHLVGQETLPRGGLAIPYIVRAAKLIKEKYGTAPLVIVDYLQDLVRGSTEEMRTAAGTVTRELRSVSQSLDCPVVAIAAVSRAYYGQSKQEAMRATQDATAYLASAKESGDIDYDAATVLFLDVDTSVDAPSRPARICVAKSRHGQTGFAGAIFHGASGRWEQCDESLASMKPGGGKSEADNGEILAAMEKLGFPASVVEIADALGKNKMTVLTKLKEMKDAGSINYASLPNPRAGMRSMDLYSVRERELV